MRRTREQKREQAVADIINKMFEIAGHEVTFDDIKERTDDWYTQWTMTIEQSDEWQEWGRKYLQKTLRLRKEAARLQMSWFCLQYGLKFSDWEEYYNTKRDE